MQCCKSGPRSVLKSSALPLSYTRDGCCLGSTIHTLPCTSPSLLNAVKAIAFATPANLHSLCSATCVHRLPSPCLFVPLFTSSATLRLTQFAHCLLVVRYNKYTSAVVSFGLSLPSFFPARFSFSRSSLGSPSAWSSTLAEALHSLAKLSVCQCRHLHKISAPYHKEADSSASIFTG